jgi:alpha-acetolactate decarboxylase
MKLILVFSAFLIINIIHAQNKEIVVGHKGVLHEIMAEQKIDANAVLSDYKEIPNLFALGALEGLAGEILIINGKPLNGISKEGKVIFDRSFSKSATLLVYSSIEEWTKVELNQNLDDLKQLESIIKQEAFDQGIDVNNAFPFLVKGNLSRVEWHIINAAEAKEKSHEAFKKAGLKEVSDNISGQILGFYSQNHGGVFTHRGSFSHLHFVDEKETIMGHVDQLKVNGKVTLFLPKVK